MPIPCTPQKTLLYVSFIKQHALVALPRKTSVSFLQQVKRIRQDGVSWLGKNESSKFLEHLHRLWAGTAHTTAVIWWVLFKTSNQSIAMLSKFRVASRLTN